MTYRSRKRAAAARVDEDAGRAGAGERPVVSVAALGATARGHGQRQREHGEEPSAPHYGVVDVVDVGAVAVADAVLGVVAVVVVGCVAVVVVVAVVDELDVGVVDVEVVEVVEVVDVVLVAVGVLVACLCDPLCCRRGLASARARFASPPRSAPG